MHAGERIGVLNGFRAFAALWVLVGHCAIWTGLGDLATKTAVDLFMVLSGFLMAHVLQADDLSPSSVLAFYRRRFLRIAPAYYLALAMAVALAPQFLAGYTALQDLHRDLWPIGGIYDPVHVDYGWRNLLLHASFLFGLFPRASFSTGLPDWSLSLEAQFYLAFPAILVAARRYGAIATALALWGASLVGTMLVEGLVEPFREPSLLAFKLQVFLAGMLLHAALTMRGARTRTFAALLAAAMTAAESLLLLGIGALLLVSLRPGCPALLHRVLSSRALAWMADVSFSVYLLHGFWLALIGSRIAVWATGAGIPTPAIFAAVLAAVAPLTYASAWLVYLHVEAPCIRIGKARRAHHRPHAPKPAGGA